MRHTSSGRTPAAFPCENLENRRLFAAGLSPQQMQAFIAALESAISVPMMHGGYHGYDHRYDHDWHNDGNGGNSPASTVPANAGTDVASDDTIPTVTVDARPADTAGQRVAVAASVGNDTVVQVKTAPPAATAATPTVAAVLDGTAPVAVTAAPAPADATFTVKLAAGVKPSWSAAGPSGQAAVATGSGLANLLARSARGATFVSAPAGDGISGQAAPAKAAEAVEMTLPVAPASVTAAQAALMPTPAIAGHRPLWQTVAAATAGAVLVSANWAVRRRNRKTALAVRRGTL